MDLLAPWDRVVALAWEAHAEGSIGVGAVVTDQSGSILGEGRNRRTATGTPGRIGGARIAHAEVDALGLVPPTEDLVLWTSLEPCVLCRGAAVISHVATIHYGGPDPLWQGLERMPDLNHQVARRWPTFIGPADGKLAAWCALVPLVDVMTRYPSQSLERAYESDWPALLELARADHTVEALNESSEWQEAAERLWPHLPSWADS